MLQVAEYALDQIDLDDTSWYNRYYLTWSNLICLIGALVSTVLDTGEKVDVTDTVEVDICEDTIFTTTNEVILDKPSNSIPCTDTSEYEWNPDKICELDLVINCETVDGTPIDWNAISISKTTDYYTVDVKYIYTVTNVGPTNDNINRLSRTLNVNDKDLTSGLDTTELVPGDDIVTTEIVFNWYMPRGDSIQCFYWVRCNIRKWYNMWGHSCVWVWFREYFWCWSWNRVCVVRWY